MSTSAGTVLSRETTSTPGNPTTRRVPRYKLTVPLAMTVLRAGIPNAISGRTVEIGEGGLGVVPASDLHVGESVRVEFFVPQVSMPVRATAVVRYQNGQNFGLQFLRLPVEQESIVRYWTRRQGELLLCPADGMGEGAAEESGADGSKPQLRLGEAETKFDLRRLIWIALPMVVISAVLGWWHWEQGWAELEKGLPGREAEAQPQLQVPGEVMARQIAYRVMPEYPEAARRAGVQGTVTLDAVVGADGAVTGVKVVSGPESLAQAGVDAVRWWRYAPYRVNGQPKTIETTVALEFRLAK